MKRIFRCILILLSALFFSVSAFAQSIDVNGDGAENLLDVIWALKTSVCAPETAETDVDGDGTTTAADVLYLLSRLINRPAPVGMTDISQALTFTPKNVSWSYTDGVLTLNSISYNSDGFGMSDIYIPSGTAFELEATMQILEGNCGGITFGVCAPEVPTLAWYCVNVDKGAKNTRLFANGTGTVGAGTATQRRLTDAELAKDTYTLRVAVTERGRISFYLDGGFVAAYDEADLSGGYIGFNAFRSHVAFKNISLRVGECALPSVSPIHTVNGNWRFAGGTLTASNANAADRFAMTDVYVPRKTPFSVEATLEVLGGRKTGAILFGVTDPDTPSAGWYGANVAIAENVARLFSVKTGTFANGADTNHALTEAQLSQTEFAMRLTVDADGTVRYYLDNICIFERTESDFAGGYIGFNTYRSSVAFRDIVITVDGKVIPLASDTSLTAGDRQFPLSAAAVSQTVDLGAYDGEVTLTLPDGYTARLGNTKLAGGKYTFTPDIGRTRLAIDLRDRYARKTTTTITLWRDIPTELLYTDTYRPKLHVTPPMNFMNDPNGLHYNAQTGEYHAYYQWNPTQLRMGNQVWGHAVSKDLLHWTDHGIAIDRPADGDAIYSGCAVIDRENTSGLFDESVAPDNCVVALYTVTNPFRQEIAYSTDGGYTFTKYSGNPVIASSPYFANFRDPKVLWIEEKQLWLMAIAGGPFALYTSPDLIQWTSQGVMTYADGTVIESEFPTLLHLPLDGDTSNKKYVYIGDGDFYVVGDLVWEGDSVRFVPTQEKVAPLFYSDANHATQDFYNDPAGRTLLMSWMRDQTSAFRLEDKYWHGILSMPCETALVTENGKAVLHFSPIAELEQAKANVLCNVSDITLTNEALAIENANALYALFDLKARLYDGASLTLGMREGDGCQTAIRLEYLSDSAVRVTLDAKASGAIVRGAHSVTVQTDADGFVSLCTVLDNSVIEAFTSDGRVFADFIFPPKSADGFSLTAIGTAEIADFSAHTLQ